MNYVLDGRNVWFAGGFKDGYKGHTISEVWSYDIDRNRYTVAPLLPETRRLIDAARIARMKPGAYLINVARGGLLDDDAVVSALDDGRLAGAGLDVFEPEPPPADARLRGHPKVIATPHLASVTVDGRTRTESMAIEQILAFVRGERPEHALNPEVL